jgi:seryl-tRNA synthetase
MIRIAVLVLGLVALGGTGRAQDIVGIEDCTKTTGLDRRTGCLQSNVNFLQSLVNKNAIETAQKLKATEAEIAALKSAVTSLQKAIEQIQAAQKGAGEKKPESK